MYRDIWGLGFRVQVPNNLVLGFWVLGLGYRVFFSWVEERIPSVTPT